MSKEKHTLVEALGWYGVGAILVAYALLSFGFLAPHSLAYQLLNLTGGVTIIVDAWVDRNYQPVFLNIIWSLVAIVAIAQIFLRS